MFWFQQIWAFAKPVLLPHQFLKVLEISRENEALFDLISFYKTKAAWESFLKAKLSKTNICNICQLGRRRWPGGVIMWNDKHDNLLNWPEDPNNVKICKVNEIILYEICKKYFRASDHHESDQIQFVVSESKKLAGLNFISISISISI